MKAINEFLKYYDKQKLTELTAMQYMKKLASSKVNQKYKNFQPSIYQAFNDKESTSFNKYHNTVNDAGNKMDMLFDIYSSDPSEISKETFKSQALNIFDKNPKHFVISRDLMEDIIDDFIKKLK